MRGLPWAGSTKAVIDQTRLADRARERTSLRYGWLLKLYNKNSGLSEGSVQESTIQPVPATISTYG